MHCGVAEAQERITSSEFAEWVALYRLEPWGPERDNLHAALIAMVMANAWRGKGQPASIEDFMLNARTEKPEKTSKELEWQAAMLNAKIAGKVYKKKIKR